MHRRTEAAIGYVLLAILAVVAMVLTYLRPGTPH